MISTKFWSDPWVVDELNPLDRYLFMYLLTNEHTTVGGVYEISLRTMSNETGLEKEELSRMLARLESRVVFADGWVVFRKSIAHQNIGSPKIKAAIAQTLKTLPPQLLQYVNVPADFGELLKAEYGIDTVSIGYTYGMGTVSHSNLNSNININSNINSNVAKATKALKVPSAEIDSMFELWETIVGFPLQGNKQRNRRACSNLLKTHGADKLELLLKGVKQSHEDRYAPRISDFVSLQTKLNDLIVWGRKKGTAHAIAQF